jgi:hypothetical protein
MRSGRTTEPVLKSSISGQLNWIIEVVSSICLCFGLSEAGSSLPDSLSDRAGRTRAASFFATRFASRDWQLEQLSTRLWGGVAHVTVTDRWRISWGSGSIFPCLRVRLFVAVPVGSLSHFHEPTQLYLLGSEEELASAKSTVTRTCVSTRDFVPPSGILGTIIGRL